MSVRVAVVGSVDNGKSTLIGRLLSDTEQVPDDKKKKVQSLCEQQQRPYEYAFLLDALEEEQTQGITLDVTEVLWKNLHRQYLFVDTPGHREFLKKMIGGASSVDGVLLLVDATSINTFTIQQQIKLLDLLGIDQKIILLNKMDRVDWSSAFWTQVQKNLADFVNQIPIIPVSAWHGANLLLPSTKMPWYQGPTLVDAMSLFNEKKQREGQKNRFQIQDVYNKDELAVYVGRVESGQFHQGEIVECFPGRHHLSIESFSIHEEHKEVVCAGDSVGLVLSNPQFLNRGTWIYPPYQPPHFLKKVTADIFWIAEHPLKKGEVVKIKFGTTQVLATVGKIFHEWEEGTLRCVEDAGSVRLMGRVEFHFESQQPIDFFDDNEVTSRFIVCRDFFVVGGGRWIGAPGTNKVYWFAGLSGAGKTTLTQHLEKRLTAQGQRICVIDGDVLRQGVSKDLGFSNSDRLENIRRAAVLAKQAIDAGAVVLAAFISPLKAHRDLARQIVGSNSFVEVFVDCSIEECERRDVKGLYAKARRGELQDLTGIGSVFEFPQNPDLHLRTDVFSIQDILNLVQKFMEHQQYQQE